MRPSDPHLVAHALALAFLATDGTELAMREVAVAVVGSERAWIRGVVRAARRAFDPITRASLDDLTLTIARSRAFARVRRPPERWVEPSEPPVRIRRYVVAPGVMFAPRWDVPVIDTVGDLATWLEVSIAELEWLADRSAMLVRAPAGPLHHYLCTWIAKPSGGARPIEAPKARLAAIQRRILREILDRVPPHDASHGFRRGRSVASFVAPHVGRALVVRVDLEDFFASVPRGRVFGLFRSAGYPDEVARTLAALTTTRTPSYALRDAPRDVSHPQKMRLRIPHLPQGAPTSPALASLAAFRMDARLEGLARALDARYSRYADDLAISFPRSLPASAIDRLLASLAAIASEEGFVVRAPKTRVMRRGARQTLAGVVINERAAVPREEYERLRAILHRASLEGPRAEDLAAHADYRAHLAGRIAWIASWSPARGERLRALFERIPWPTEP